MPRLMVMAICMLATLAAACSQAPAAPAATSVAGAKPQAGTGAPVVIRYGGPSANDEPIYLIQARPQLAPNFGKSYTLQLTRFPGNTERMTAYDAGQLDAGVNAAPTLMAAASKGVDFKIVASLSREQEGGSLVTAFALKSSGIKSAADLKGKTVAIVAPRSGADLMAREGIRRAGLNPDRDVQIIVVPFPAQGESLRAGKIDVAILPSPFSELESAKGDLVPVFTSVGALGFPQESLDIFFRPSFISAHPDAVKAFLSDYVAAVKWWKQNRLEGYKALVDAKLVSGDPQQLAGLQDPYRPSDGKIDVESLEKVQDLLVTAGWQEKKANLKEFVDNSLLPAS